MPKTRKRGNVFFVEYTEALNLTENEVIMYDTYGDIVHIAPKKFAECIVKLHEDLMVIVNNLSEGLAFGISPDNIVVPQFPASSGRKMRPIQKLERPKDKALVSFSPILKGESADEIYL